MSKAIKNLRVCIVGAGPSGMSLLYHFDKLKKEGQEIPEVVCYDKQETCGGLWNYSWRTGTDEFGDCVHNGMYHYLWSNGPKEASLEYPDYLFDEHFGKPIPSYPPRAVLYDYLKGRWSKSNLQSWVQCQKSVRNITFDDATNVFTVEVKDLKENVVMEPQTFDYVLIASGHFSVPSVPNFEGLDTFHGRVMHSHDFRDAREFADKTVLFVGSSYSAEDLAIQCLKYGSKTSIISCRSTGCFGYNGWPETVIRKPVLTKVVNKTCYFDDGSSTDVDAIVLCTGYLNCYKYLEDKLRLTGPNILYPEHLYKGVVWQRGGNNKCLYIGAQDQYYTYTMFDAQAHWICKYITGKLALPDRSTMEKDWKMWHEKEKTGEGHDDHIRFQSAYVVELAKESDYGHNLDVTKQFIDWEDNKRADIMTYRDKQSFSNFTGKLTPIHHTVFQEAWDDSLETYLNN